MTNKDIAINKLCPEDVRGTALVFSYTTDGYFDVRSLDGDKGFSLVLKSFQSPVSKSFKDTLCAEWVENPVVFEAVLDDERAGIIELSLESWNNRLSVTNILVQEGVWGRGVGRALMEKAAEYAAEVGARALILETQSCNLNAMAFYKRCGFRLCGLDTSCYSNSDNDKKEVRLEFWRPL